MSKLVQTKCKKKLTSFSSLLNFLSFSRLCWLMLSLISTMLSLNSQEQNSFKLLSNWMLWKEFSRPCVQTPVRTTTSQSQHLLEIPQKRSQSQSSYHSFSVVRVYKQIFPPIRNYFTCTYRSNAFDNCTSFQA